MILWHYYAYKIERNRTTASPARKYMLQKTPIFCQGWSALQDVRIGNMNFKVKNLLQHEWNIKSMPINKFQLHRSSQKWNMKLFRKKNPKKTSFPETKNLAGWWIKKFLYFFQKYSIQRCLASPNLISVFIFFLENHKKFHFQNDVFFGCGFKGE